MAGLGDEHGALEGEEDGAVGFLARGLHGHDALGGAGFGFPLGEHLRFGVDRVSGENGRAEADVVPSQIGDGQPTRR